VHRTGPAVTPGYGPTDADPFDAQVDLVKRRAVLAGLAAAGEPQRFLDDTYGRVRRIVPAPDGSLWLVSNNTDGRATPRPGDDRIVRLEVTRAARRPIVGRADTVLW